MRLKGLDLNLLTVLDALLKERSVSRAATSLDLGQSAVSSALARLREHFEDELLVPLNRQMVPTALALDLHGPVKEWLQGIDSIVHAQPEFNPRDLRREFVVLCSDYVAETFMPRLIRLLAEEAPGATIAVRPLDASVTALPEGLARRGAHFCILPSEHCSHARPRAHLFHERFCAVVWQDNPDIGETLTLGQLRELPHVAVQFSDDSPDALDARPLVLSGVVRKTRVVVDQFMLATQAVIGTTYITLIPYRLGRQWADSLPLRLLELPEGSPNIEFDEVLQWNEAQLADQSLHWFRDLILEAAKIH
ncbi:LysR family transcriptional regulator [Burkholderia ubonensis]|uniref:LysR family transcriptional regulator n=1 Tax=Burkholderia ubonensis TaxID=101571 RepID=UPI002ABDBC79|nr:LysR family transcriptional regulator [Burkholderia ubonensis]